MRGGGQILHKVGQDSIILTKILANAVQTTDIFGLLSGTLPNIGITVPMAQFMCLENPRLNPVLQYLKAVSKGNLAQ